MLTAKAIAQYQTIFTENLSRRQDPEERRALTEVVMVLMVGILYGLYNPHQVARELAIAPKRLYSELKQLDARAWRRLLERMMSQAALERLQSYQAHSAATRSRRQASLSIDDTVQKRLGKALSYVWSWYSGQAKKTLAGQDLVGIVLCMGNEIIPLRLVWVSKQGRGGTGKVAVVLKEMEKLKAEFSKAGIDLTQLGVSFDSWWVNEEFSVGNPTGTAVFGSIPQAGGTAARLGAFASSTSLVREQSNVWEGGGDFLCTTTQQSVCIAMPTAGVARL